MEIIFFLLVAGLALSAPVFYLWGLVEFFRSVFGSSKKRQRRDEPPLAGRDETLMQTLRQRALDEPDLTLAELLAEQGVPGPWSETEAQAAPTVEEAAGPPAGAPAASDDKPKRHPTATDDPPEKPKQAPQPTSNWYGDNAINLLLFLGTFLMVAAVSLFIGFNWQSFSAPFRFGVVLVFALGWFVGGFTVQQALKLDAIALAFITIGALLMPFVGLAGQLYVVQDPDAAGMTWFVTSLLVTPLYLALSWVYRRRYFTYFGTLSTLAALLAVVELNELPTEYYIFTAVAGALVLLLARLALRWLPEDAQAFYADDIERSSLATIAAGLVLGLLAVGLGDVEYYSVQVLAVVVVTTVYAWVYVTLRQTTVSLTAAQVVTLLLVDHVLFMVGVNDTARLLFDAGAHIGLLVGMNVWLARQGEHTLSHNLNHVALVITGLFYVVSIALDEQIIAMSFAAGLGLHAAYVAAFHKQPLLYHLTGLSGYIIIGHLWAALDLGVVSLFGLGVAMSIAEVLVLLAPLPIQARRALARVGLLGAFGTALYMAAAYNDALINLNDSVLFGQVEGVLLFGGAISAYILTGVLEWRASEPVLKRPVYLLMGLVGGLIFVFGYVLQSEFVAAVLLALAGVNLVFVYLNTEDHVVIVPVVWALYGTVLHLLLALGPALVVYPLVLAALTVAFYLAAKRLLPALNLQRWAVSAALAAHLAGVVTWVLVSGFDGMTATYVAGWVTGYTLLGVLWVERDIYGAALRDYLLAGAGVVQYYWHLFYLVDPAGYDLFMDIQWFVAGAAVVLLLLAYREREREQPGRANTLGWAAAVALFVPTLLQVAAEGQLAYFLVAVAYALGFVALGVSWDERDLRRIGAFAMVGVVFLQSREFLANLPRWFVVGLVGFGLIFAAVYLSLRRRETETEG